jgi:hypothetical protein
MPYLLKVLISELLDQQPNIPPADIAVCTWAVMSNHGEGVMWFWSK